MSATEDYPPIVSITPDADAALTLKDAPLAELDAVDEVVQEATLESIPFMQDHHRADTPTKVCIEEHNETEAQNVKSASPADDEAEIWAGNNGITEAIPMEVIDTLPEDNRPTEVYHVDHGMVLISEELQTPEQQRRAARLSAGEDSADESAITPMIAMPTTLDLTPQVELENSGNSKVPRKKPTSTERRAARDAKRAEAALTLPANNDNETIPGSLAAKIEVGTEAADDAGKQVTKARKLNSKQRKARNKRLAATLETTTTVEAAVPVSSQSGDNSHPANEQSGTVTGDGMINATSSVAVASGSASEAPPKAKKLNSKTRKARKRAAEAIAAAEAAGLASAPIAAAPAAVEAKPASASFHSSTVDPAGAVPAEKKTKVKAGRATSEVAASAAKQDKHSPVSEQPAETSQQPARISKLVKTSLSADQHIALHATLTALRQGLLSRDSVIYTQQAAMKMHLLTEVCKLGYECVEGGANSFQQIAWSAPNQCLTYTAAILNAPHQYPPSLRPKGDLKIIAPGLSLQLKCYPTFGAGSPALLGKKAFQQGFIKHFAEVAQGETDVFVFVLPAEVYRQFALEAVTSLPVVQEIKRYFSAHRVTFTNNKSAEESRMRAELCTVETGYGEFVIGSVH